MPAPVPGSRRRPMRRLVPGLVLAALALVAATVFLPRLVSGEDPNHTLAQRWDRDLTEWAAAAQERIGTVPGPQEHSLNALFDPRWAEPIGPPLDADPADGADLDAVNAACTDLIGLLEAISNYVEPPAAPPDLDTTSTAAEDTLERFTTYQQSLATLRESTSVHLPRTRVFCGTYPATLAAHADAAPALAVVRDAVDCSGSECELRAGGPDLPVPAALVEPNERIAASLAAQCHHPDLEQVCALEAQLGRDLAEAFSGWTSDPEGSLQQAAHVLAEHDDALAASGSDRQEARREATGLISEAQQEIDAAVAAFAAALA